MALVLEQALNDVQFGVTLFLLAAGLTLVFGIMGVINLAHGSLYMVGAYAAAAAAKLTGSFLLAIPAGLGAAALTGMIVEYVVVRKLYARDHLDQVLATFGLILFFNQTVILLFGRQPVFVQIPSALSGAVDLGLFAYPVYRLCIIAAGLLTGVGLYWLIQRTRLGMLVRAGATHREMVQARRIAIMFARRALLLRLQQRDAGIAFVTEAEAGPVLARALQCEAAAAKEVTKEVKELVEEGQEVLGDYYGVVMVHADDMDALNEAVRVVEHHLAVFRAACQDPVEQVACGNEVRHGPYRYRHNGAISP